jgi:hypothetical protein
VSRKKCDARKWLEIKENFHGRPSGSDLWAEEGTDHSIGSGVGSFRAYKGQRRSPPCLCLLKPRKPSAKTLLPADSASRLDPAGTLKHERIKKAKRGGDKISLTNHSGWVKSNRHSKARVKLYPWHGGKKGSWSFQIFMGVVTGTHGHPSWNSHHPALRLSCNPPRFVLA